MLESLRVTFLLLFFIFFLEGEGRAFHATDFYEIPKNYDYANSIPRAYLRVYTPTLPSYRKFLNVRYVVRMLFSTRKRSENNIRSSVEFTARFSNVCQLGCDRRNTSRLTKYRSDEEDRRKRIRRFSPFSRYPLLIEFSFQKNLPSGGNRHDRAANR